MAKPDGSTNAGTSVQGAPRFGSYIGLFFVAVILGILFFALLHDPGTNHAFDGLRPGMSSTEVAAVLGVAQAENKEGTLLVQTWRIPDGTLFEVRFQDGKLVAKQRKAAGRATP